MLAEAKKLQAAKETVRQAIISAGVDVPENVLLDEYPSYIREIVNPPVPEISLEGLKRALDDDTARDKFPIGTEISDEWNGAENPLIVAQYLDNSNNSTYGGAEGVILIRKYADSVTRPFGDDHNYATSSVRDFLNIDYYNACSDELKAAITPISVGFVRAVSGQAETLVTVPNNLFFLMSATEVFARSSNPLDGVAWDYWKQKTGWTSPSYLSNAGRSIYNTAGTAVGVWLRSNYNNSDVALMQANGMVYYASPKGSRSVLPACFISKTLPQPTLSLTGLKQSLKDGNAEQNFPVGTEIPDTYAGNSNPLIVAQYLDSTNNSNYGGVEGAVLVRKYVEPMKYAFGADNYYPSCEIKDFLDTDYLQNCSDELKGVVSTINVPYFDTNKQSDIPVSSTFFLMSGSEVFAYDIANYEGIAFDYWKQKTGLSSASADANNGRIMYGRDGSAAPVWLRTAYSKFYEAFCVDLDGSVAGPVDVTGQWGVLPCCFVSKN